MKDEYRKNNHYVCICRYHIVFCPKYRRKIFIGGVDDTLKIIFRNWATKNDVNILEMEVMPDHIHILLECSASLAPAEIVKSLKQTATFHLYKTYPNLKARMPTLWSRGAFIATVGSTSLDVVKRYIENQKD